ALLVDYGPEKNEIVTRGWIDPRNKDSISDSSDLEPNKPYTFTWDMEVNEYKFKEGHQIGLVIISSDNEYTKRPEPGTESTSYPAQSTSVLQSSGRYPEQASLADAPQEQEDSATKNTSSYLSLLVFSAIIALVAIALVKKKNTQ